MTDAQEFDELAEEREFDLKRFLFKYLRYWWLFALCFAISMGAAYFLYWYATPVYEISAKVLIKDENYGTRDLLRELDLETSNKNIENEIQILRSHSIFERVFNELDFGVSYYLVGDIKTSEQYEECPFYVDYDSLNRLAYISKITIDIVDATSFKMSYEYNDISKSATYEFNTPVDNRLGQFVVRKKEIFDNESYDNPSFSNREYRIRFVTKGENINMYQSRLQVGLASEGSTILELKLRHEVPQKGIDFLNKVIDVYLENDIEEKNRMASKTSEFINDRIGDISTDLGQIESELKQYKVDRGIVDLSAESRLVLEQLQSIDGQISEKRAEISLINYLENYVRLNSDDLSNLAPSILDIKDPVLIRLVNELSDQSARRKELSFGHKKNNPQLVNLDEQITHTVEALQRNIVNVRASIQKEIDEMEVRLRGLNGKISAIPQSEQGLIEIERQYRIKESLYLYLSERNEEISISLAASVSDKRPIERAKSTPYPISPVKSKIYSIALLLGLCIPLLFIFLKERLNVKIRDKGMIEQLTKVPVIGVVGFSKGETNLIVHEKPKSIIAEGLRAVRTNLKYFQKQDSKQQTILVTSSISTEGKTFTSINLSTIMALSGKENGVGGT